MELFGSGTRGIVVIGAAVAMVPCATSMGHAQVLPPVHAEMARVAPLVGEWEGEGWMEYEPGQRGEFRGTERVELRMGGRLVVVEGSFTAWMGPELGDVPVHEALGIFSYDAEAQRMIFRTYTATGIGGAAHDVEFVGDGIVWGYEDPRFGTVRFTITVDGDVWQEHGVVSRDGGEGRAFFAMTLRRR